MRVGSKDGPCGWLCFAACLHLPAALTGSSLPPSVGTWNLERGLQAAKAPQGKSHIRVLTAAMLVLGFNIDLGASQLASDFILFFLSFLFEKKIKRSRRRITFVFTIHFSPKVGMVPPLPSTYHHIGWACCTTDGDGSQSKPHACRRGSARTARRRHVVCRAPCVPCSGESFDRG